MSGSKKIIVAGFLLLNIMIAGCWKRIDTEASRFTSPDNKVDAVYIQSDAGAMTSVRHSIYIVPKGQKPTKKDVAVFSGNRVWDLKITWDSDHKLRVQPGSGKIYHFQNYLYPFSENKEYMVEIVLDTLGKEGS